MSLYIFKYNVSLTGKEVEAVGRIDIENRLRRAKTMSQVFGTIGHGTPVTDHVFITKANNYRQCIQLIEQHKALIERVAWQRCTFGEMWTGLSGTRVERYETLGNRLHVVSCENSKGFTDMLICYKVTEEIKDRIQFMDAMPWAKSCIGAGYRGFELGEFSEYTVYNR